jgi:S-adenosylmethionine hydrolase
MQNFSKCFLISNISEQRLLEFSQHAPVTIWLARHLIGGLNRNYAEARPHAPVALIGSFGFLEIGVNLGNAELKFSAQRGTPIIVKHGQTASESHVML